MRLDRYLALSGAGCKKYVRGLINDGRITVNGDSSLAAYDEIDEAVDKVCCDGQPLTYRGCEYYMFNKPMGCVTARCDDNAKTIFEYLKGLDMSGLFPVGRLDKDTEGLLLITNDGEFNHQLMYPDKHVSKKYFFLAKGRITPEEACRIESGVVINQGEKATSEALLELLDTGSYSEITRRYNAGVKEDNSIYDPIVTAGYLTIYEGRKHQVKRMLMSEGHRVVYLKRVKIGGLMLDETLEKGNYRSMTREEISACFHL